ncbi:MAG TPA: 50S ribosomal protein L15 [Candidatus Limnocylindrales bacterium]
MKLHDLRPADGAHVARTRVGRGIAAGKGKTAGRGTKGQKARAGGSIPPWFEGGQTPLHMRIPKLRGFKNRAKIQYEIVNVGDIDARVEAGAFARAGTAPKKGEQLTINADILRAVGLVRDVRKPLKVLGAGELSTALFVVADAFTKSATDKIEKAGGTISVLEVPATASPALGVDGEPGPRTARAPRTAAGREAADREANARARRESDSAEAKAAPAAAAPVAAAAADSEPAESKPARADRAGKAGKPAKSPAAKPGKASSAADDTAADDAGPVEAAAGADVAEVDEAASVDEPAESPDAVADASDEAPVPGDTSESDSAVPGDDA